MPPITLYFLQASRSIRTAWLLEELGLDYEVKFFDRQSNQKAPPEFKEASKNPLGKAPTLWDGDVMVYESGAITEYLIDQYDKSNKYLPPTSSPTERARVQGWIHAAEGTFMLHALAITYARWFTPKRAHENGDTAETEKGMSANVQRDLDWLEAELGRSPSGWIVGGDGVTAADIMMHFSVQFIFERKLGVAGPGDEKKWPAVEKWLRRCESEPAYKKAVEKTGYTLNPTYMTFDR